MNDIQLFAFKNKKVMTLLVNNEPWFIGKDVADILGYSNPRDALSKHVDDEDKNSVAIRDGNKGNPNQTIINESGVYGLIFSSKLPDAKSFKRWVTTEVLPQIRVSGSYQKKELTGEKLMAKAFIEAKSIMERQSKEIEEMKPKALFADTVSASESSVLVSVVAKALKQKGYDIGQNRMFEWLHKNKYLCSRGLNRNVPTQRSLDLGVMEFKTRVIGNPNGTAKEVITPMITGKGQVYFVNKYIEQFDKENETEVAEQ